MVTMIIYSKHAQAWLLLVTMVMVIVSNHGHYTTYIYNHVVIAIHIVHVKRNNSTKSNYMQLNWLSLYENN